MDHIEAKTQHQALALLGVRDTGTTIGLLQLCSELQHAGILGADAVERIKDAIVSDISLSCPRSRARAEYALDIRHRIDGLMQH
ncbi:hypothetical protein D1610_07425 [Sphingomonas gilva]|uniref:Uncharacterized protein n=1 Tax=Sphingomonas gilva TaxID=2305907 RepID=A0A396RSG5_9SPHN|nr:hypothetical protein [Sphingomonas gilva]RHW18292.1 hypothetical protein D1610_07425 [Sphingomonas gilva]